MAEKNTKTKSTRRGRTKAGKTSKTGKATVEQYVHSTKQRANIPEAGLVTPDTDPLKDERQTYEYDPHLDPALQWAGKAERTSFDVQTVSLHVHERIDPRTIINQAKRLPDDAQPELFAERRPLREAVDFYKHKDDWSNRFVAGDSLLVMNSLLQKESMGGKVQMVYFDPPYGIKYQSNFQPFVNEKSVKDSKDEDLTSEPEMIKAFRDTWELGIHSYLSYMRDRLMLARELLADSGSVFVQIGSENVHRVSMVLDDIFGAENRVATISFATTSGSSSKTLPEVADYLLWYAKDKTQAKYHQLYEQLTRAEIMEFFSSYVMVEMSGGSCRPPTDQERIDPAKHLPEEARIYQRTGLDSQGISTTGRSEPYKWNGRAFPCGKNRQWSVSHEYLDRLADMGRLEALESQDSLRWKKYEDEVPGRRINNIWPAQMYPGDKRYVVETAVKAIQRCLLMTTDPGDLVLDITCGSGTSALVAEQWGRRWITCDTSRVALALAKQRLMTATFDYYKLKDEDAGIGGGLQCKIVSTVSPKTLAEGTTTETVLVDQPLTDRKRARVTGPFTVEAVPSPMVMPLVDTGDMGDTAGEPAGDGIDTMGKSAPAPEADRSIARSGATLRHAEWRDELLKSGIRGKNNQRISFANIEPLPATRYLHAEATTRPDDSGARQVGESDTATQPRRVMVSFGPEHAPMDPRQVEMAVQEAEKLRPKPDLIVFAAFQFDPEAAKDIDETDWPGVRLLKVQMNADMQNQDLKKKQTNSDSFWLVGQPDIRLHLLRSGPHTGKWQVAVKGFDYFDTKTGEITSGAESNIAVWMLDTDYDGRSLYPRQVFFPCPDHREGDLKHGWNRLAKALSANIDEDLMDYYHGTQSIPFNTIPMDKGGYERIAVKIIDNRGIESLRIMPVKK